MTMEVLGLHHVTAIAGDPQANMDFYTKVLGLRLVKVTVEWLGTRLILPDWLEPRRAELVSVLPKLRLPKGQEIP